ncbi:site-specific DNA-methyltransferase [Lutibacter sp. B2]|nr:site-specific DNA-methyltransferase [Lutibacter sp. B2]
MDKLEMQSKDLVGVNIENIAKLFPNVITESKNEEGILEKKIDFDLLKQELSDTIVEGNKERYSLTWPGKKEAILAANMPINKTLRPVKKDSEDWDTTENMYIEGDNLEVLKILQESYLNKIKCIYIDPPYNTGKDFVYRDNFTGDKDEYLEESGQVDEEGNRLFQNNESNGRFHSDWLTMMYSRLKVARNLLKDDGIIFISIDENEVENLKKICNGILGENNFISQLVWNLKTGTQAGYFTRSHEYVLVYSKNKSVVTYFKDRSGGVIQHGALKKISKVNPASEVHFTAGSIEFEGEDAIFQGELGGSEKQFIKSDCMEFKNGLLKNDVVIEAGWAMKNQLLSWLRGEETFDSKGQRVLRFYFNSKGILFYEKERGTVHPKTVLDNVGNTKNGSDELKSLFGLKYFDFPKPTELLKYLIEIVTEKEDIILDFFSGSATTAQSVMQINADDGGNRKFIMVQLPEETNEKTDAYKAGYKNICEIGKERIRRAAKKIKEETNADIDYGFRVYKVDSTNMKDTFYSVNEIKQDFLTELESNIKDDRTSEDLLAQVMLDLGIELSLPIQSEKIEGKEVFYVADNALVACFDEDINEEVAKKIAERGPLKVVFRDRSFSNDSDKENIKEVFKKHSPDTDIKVL